MSIPDAPLDLTSDEAEAFASPHFHPYERCGELEKRFEYRHKATIRRFFCVVHQVYVWNSGWEIGLSKKPPELS